MPPFSNLKRAACCLVLVAAVGCATASNRAAPTPPVTQIEMDPIKIEASPAGDGSLQLEAFDAAGLFEQAGAALSQKRSDEAIRLYDKLLKEFPTSDYVRHSLYNRGVAQIDKKDWANAANSFKTVAEKFHDHADAKDALFQLGACYAELENWPASGEVFARLLERQDLSADDRIEAIARRGFAQFNVSDLDTAEKTFRTALQFKQRIEGDERLQTDFYLAFSQYHLAQVTHKRFQKVALRLPESQMDRDMEEKARLLLEAQRGYIATINYRNAAWASAAGFQVGSLYEELHEAFIHAPVPSNLDGEARRVYGEELHKKIRILLEKSLRWQRENLLMIERLGVNTDWGEKSKVSYAKLMKLLDPQAKPEFDGTPAPAPKPAPAAPPAPDRTRPPGETPPAGDIGPRQIL